MMRGGVALTALALLGACGNEGSSTAATLPPSLATEPPASGAPSSARPSTVPESTVQSVSDATSSPPATTAAMSRLTTTTATTEAAPFEGVIDTTNASVFGLPGVALADPDDVIEQVHEFVGDATWDTGWLPMSAEFVCTGSDSFRTIWWGDLRMTFENGRDGTWLTAWSVGDPAVSSLAPLGSPPPDDGRPPTGLHSREGIGIGTPADQVRSVLGDRLYQDDEDRMVVLSGAITTSILLDDDQRVSAIGSGRTDCIDGSTV